MTYILYICYLIQLANFWPLEMSLHNLSFLKFFLPSSSLVFDIIFASLIFVIFLPDIKEKHQKASLLYVIRQSSLFTHTDAFISLQKNQTKYTLFYIVISGFLNLHFRIWQHRCQGEKQNKYPHWNYSRLWKMLQKISLLFCHLLLKISTIFVLKCKNPCLFSLFNNIAF